MERRKFQGALNILSFNRHFYIAGIGLLIFWIAAYFLFDWSATLFWIVIIAFLYGLLVPLLVSAYVYDHSDYYSLKWLNPIIDKKDDLKLIVNIHAGFDETSYIIKEKYPRADLKVFDFYNAAQHTELAIKVARKATLFYPDTKSIVTTAIPLEDNSADIVFLLSAVHEIRSNEEKVQFLKECRRICKPDGKVIMVEHLRDLPNFLAFSIGFTHFFSAFVWKRCFSRAGFSNLQEVKFTPFMSIFKCSP